MTSSNSFRNCYLASLKTELIHQHLFRTRVQAQMAFEIYEALPLYPGFGFIFSTAAGCKMIVRESPQQHGLCAQQTVVLGAEGKKTLDEFRVALSGYLRPSTIVSFHICPKRRKRNSPRFGQAAVW